MKYYTLKLILFLVFNSAALGNPNLLELVQKKWDSIESLEASFYQSTSSSISKEIKAEGTLKFQKPNLVRWEYSKPDLQLVVMGKENVWIYDSILNNVSVTKKEKLSQEHIFDYLSKKKGLKANFSLLNKTQYPNEFIIEANQKIIYLQPKNKTINIQELHLLINNENYLIQGALIIDLNSQINKFYLKNLKTNVKLKKDLFVFIPKEGTEIINEK